MSRESLNLSDSDIEHAEIQDVKHAEIQAIKHAETQPEVQAEALEVDDWQSNKDFLQTNLMMLELEALADVKFLVGKDDDEEEILAHKFMLASRSCVFFAMFCGPVAEKGDVKIPDIEPDVFRDFLRYLYTGVIALSPASAMSMLYCAKKYCIKSLEKEVVQFCQSSITVDNACALLEQACLFGEEELKNDVLMAMKREMTTVMQSQGFNHLSHSNLDTLLNMDGIQADEETIFKGTLNWAKAECRRKGLGETGSDMRTILGDTIYKIRFPLMPQSVFVDLVGSTGVLTDAEKVKILERYISPRSSIAPFIGKSRHIEPEIYTLKRLVKGDRGASLSRVSDSLCLSGTKDAAVLRMELYAPPNTGSSTISYIKSFLNSSMATPPPSMKYYITVVVRDNQNVRLGIHHEERDVTSDDRLEVTLATPVTLKAGEKYTISATVEGSVRNWASLEPSSSLSDTAGVISWTLYPSTRRGSFGNLEEGIITGITYKLETE